MTLSSRPLLTRRDRELFAGRHGELSRVVAAIEAGFNCAIVGEPGSGRTTLANAAVAELEANQPPISVLTIYAAEIADAAGLLAAASAELTVRGWPGAVPAARPGLRLEAIDRLDSLRRQVATRASGTAAPVFLVEDVAIGAGRELFGAMRDELWTVDARWLVTMSTGRASALLRPPADVFFDSVVTLPDLGDGDSRALVRLRLPSAADDLVDLIVAAGRGNPRKMVDLAREFAADPAGADTASAGQITRDAAIDALGRPARMLAAELDSLGSAAASDPDLLDRLGWTRARAVQVLSDLEDSGLVSHRSENTGRGRPRKVYRLVTGSEYASTAGHPRPPGPDEAQ